MEQKYIDRFFKKVSPEPMSGCWLWTGVSYNGYGSLKVKKTVWAAHRFSALIHGLDMTKPVVRHMCNNPTCVNPSHLETGTQQQNCVDMVRSGNQVHQKSSTLNVIDIRNKYATGNYSKVELAAMYSVSRENIGAILSRKSWKHI